MLLSDLHKLNVVLADDRLAFVYAGAFPDEHTAQLITLGEEVMVMDGGVRGTRNKLAFILVEAYQNIVRHRARLPDDGDCNKGRCLFLMRDGGEYQHVLASDPITVEEELALSAQLRRLQGLGPDQLKELFLGRLKSDHRSARGGAGLGLIEMARRSGHDLVHTITPLDARHRLFTMKIRLGQQHAAEEGMAAVDQIRALVSTLGLVAFAKGQLTPAIQKMMLHIMELEVRLDAGRSDALARAYLAATELLAPSATKIRENCVAMARTEAGHELCLGLALDSEKADAMVRELTAVAASPHADLQRLYRDALLGRGGASGHMVALLDLARNAREPLHWERYPAAEGHELLLIGTEI